MYGAWEGPTTKVVQEGPLPDGFIPALDPEYVTIAFTLFQVLTRLCTSLAALQDRVIRHAEQRHFAQSGAIERLQDEVDKNYATHEESITELQLGSMQKDLRLNRLETENKFLMDKIRMLTIECQELLDTFRRMQETLNAVLDSNRVMHQQLDYD